MILDNLSNHTILAFELKQQGILVRLNNKPYREISFQKAAELATARNANRFGFLLEK